MSATDNPRLFRLERDLDVSGISGTGHVADGVLWPDGAVTVRWLGNRPSTVQWNSLDDLLAINGHGGATRVVWADNRGGATPTRMAPDPAAPHGAMAAVIRRVLTAEEDGGGLQGWNNDLGELAEHIARAVEEGIL